MDGEHQQGIRRAGYWRQGGVESDHRIPLMSIKRPECDASDAKERQANDVTVNAGGGYRAIATGEASTLCNSCIMIAEY